MILMKISKSFLLYISIVLSSSSTSISFLYFASLPPLSSSFLFLFFSSFSPFLNYDAIFFSFFPPFLHFFLLFLFLFLSIMGFSSSSSAFTRHFSSSFSRAQYSSLTPPPHLSSVICHLSSVTAYHLSSVICHVSSVTAALDLSHHNLYNHTVYIYLFS